MSSYYYLMNSSLKSVEVSLGQWASRVPVSSMNAINYFSQSQQVATVTVLQKRWIGST